MIDFNFSANTQNNPAPVCNINQGENMIFMRLAIFLSTVILALAISGCAQSPKKNYFLLSAQATQLEQQDITKVIGIGPIEVADYLKRQRVAYLYQNSRLHTATNDFWAEPLDAGVARVIGLNLIKENSTRATVFFPWRSDSTPSYSLRVQLHDFSYDNNQARIYASWQLVDVSHKKIIRQEHFSASTPSNSSSGAMVDAFSLLLTQMSDEISAALKSLGY